MDRDASADSSTCFRQMTDMSDTLLVRVVAPHFVRPRRQPHARKVSHPANA